MNTNNSMQVSTEKRIFSNSFRNRTRPTQAQKKSIDEKREELKKLSKPLRKKKSDGEIESINQGLIVIYAKKGHTDLKTFKEWKEAGFSINKGETALLLWGRRKTSIPPLEEEQEDPYHFYPICFVFSSKQVTAKAVK